MGLKFKAPKIRVDKKSLGNVVKNWTAPVGGVAKSAGLTDTNFVGDLLGEKRVRPGGAAGDDPFARKAAEYEQLMAESRIKNLYSQDKFTTALEKQAYGEAPSLANAQMKATQNRNLAQTLAAAQSMGASPLNMRQILNQRGESSRDMAEMGGIQRLQEQQGAQQMLGNQLGQQANTAQGFINSGFGIARAPIESAIQGEQFTRQLQAQKDMQASKNRADTTGALIKGGASLLAMSDEQQKKAPRRKMPHEYADLRPSDDGPNPYAEGAEDLGEALGKRLKKATPKAESAPKMTNSPYPQRSPDITGDGSGSSDERNKKRPSKLPSAKKEIGSFLDQLQALKYEYKDPSAPGAAPGERVGITAQDLERSSLGSKLVHNTSNGKMVDTVQGFGTVLAAQAELNRRLKKLEKK